jgi:integrase
MAGKVNHRGFGHVRKLPNGRHQASYLDPHGATYLSKNGNPRPVRYNAPKTFDTKQDAEAWLTDERRLISAGTWSSPADRAAARRERLTFDLYAGNWVEQRTLKPRTRAHYKSLLERHLVPTFGNLQLTEITPAGVKTWHALMGPQHPTSRAHAYGLLRTILAEAERDELITRNPCHIRGAGNSKRVHKIKPASLEELEVLVANMPERLQLMTLLAAWCGLRFGELTELRRKDVDTRAGILHVRRGVTRVDGELVIDTPKSDAGVRDVAIPPHLMPAVRAHLLEHTAPGRDGLLFAGRNGKNLSVSSLYGRVEKRNKQGKRTQYGWGFYQARHVADRDDLRWHDLRHTGAVLAAAAGATLAELMDRLGHSTPGAALRYQHAAEGRDLALAKRLSEIAEGTLK